MCRCYRTAAGANQALDVRWNKAHFPCPVSDEATGCPPQLAAPTSAAATQTVAASNAHLLLPVTLCENGMHRPRIYS